MHTSLNTSLIDSFANLRVLVIGDAMLDSYLHGAAGRICREAPVPVVTIAERVDVPGGAGNTAANAYALGAQVSLLAAVGNDAEAALLRRALEGCGVTGDGLIVCDGRATLVKHRVIADAQMLVRFDQGATDAIDDVAEQALLDRLRALYPLSDVVIVSDYGYGVLTPRVIMKLAELQRRYGRVLAVDSKNLPAYRQASVTLVKPNYGEQLALLGADGSLGPGPRVDTIAARAADLLRLTGAQIVAATLDTDGALLLERDEPPYRLHAQPVANPHTAGAGDTFITTMALALAAGAATAQAGELASLAASVVVSGQGTALCTSALLRNRLSGVAPGLIDLDVLLEKLADYREQGRRVVFTNGCFDILHPGHIAFLNRARALGDVLIVGVNTDASIRRLKGPQRPINTLDDRVQVLAALSCIDHLTAFGDDTPHALIRAIRPDVFVKGGNYRRDDLPEAALVEELGGRVQILPYVDDRSTTRLIERIRIGVPAELAREVGV